MFIVLEIIILPRLNMTHLISILKFRKLLFSLCEITAIFTKQISDFLIFHTCLDNRDAWKIKTFYISYM